MRTKEMQGLFEPLPEQLDSPATMHSRCVYVSVKT
jgi:hypothetical protein